MTPPRLLLLCMFLAGLALAPQSLHAAATPTQTVEEHLTKRKGGFSEEDLGPAK